MNTEDKLEAESIERNSLKQDLRIMRGPLN